jgi:hypothetical protein
MTGFFFPHPFFGGGRGGVLFHLQLGEGRRWMTSLQPMWLRFHRYCDSKNTKEKEEGNTAAEYPVRVKKQSDPLILMILKSPK